MFIPKRSPRDEQRERLYAAEHEVAAFQRDKLPTVPEMQRFVDSILGSRWLRTNFAASMAMPITVLNGYGRRMPCADAYQSTIAMPKGGRSQFIVCHEVAHVFCDRCHGDAFPFHGAEFATFELELVSRFLGEDDCRELLAAFARHNVVHYFDGDKLLCGSSIR